MPGREHGLKGAEVTRRRNFRDPSGESVTRKKEVTFTESEVEVLERMAKMLNQSVAGVIRMCVHLYAEDFNQMNELAESYRKEVDA